MPTIPVLIAVLLANINPTSTRREVLTPGPAKNVPHRCMCDYMAVCEKSACLWKKAWFLSPGVCVPPRFGALEGVCGANSGAPGLLPWYLGARGDAPERAQVDGGSTVSAPYGSGGSGGGALCHMRGGRAGLGVEGLGNAGPRLASRLASYLAPHSRPGRRSAKRRPHDAAALQPLPFRQ